MTRYSLIKIVLLGFVALTAEMTLFSTLTFLGAKIEGLLLLACFSALYLRTSREVAWACWILGLLKDLGSPGPMGVYALLFLITGLSIAHLRRILFGEHPMTQTCVVFISTVLVVVTDALITALFVGGVPWEIVLSRSLITALFTSLAAPVVIALITGPRWLLTQTRN